MVWRVKKVEVVDDDFESDTCTVKESVISCEGEGRILLPSVEIQLID